MKTYNYIIFLILLLGGLFGAIESKAQKISFSNVNPTEFPLLKVNFQAENAAGDPIENLSIDDFQVIDAGGVVDPSDISLDCIDTLEERPLLITLVIDQSTSMDLDYYNQGTRWSWVEEAVEEFLKDINWANGSLVSVLTFAQFDTWLRAPFTNDADLILDSLEETIVYGGTNYNIPFFGSIYGTYPDDVTISELFNEEDPYGERRRVVIFLTDGKHNASSSTLVGPVKVDEIVEELVTEGIAFYGIVVQDDMYEPLQEICTRANSQTKQTAFSIKTREELKNVYKWIAKDIQAMQYCTLSWITNYGCTEQSRQRTIQLKCHRVPTEPGINPVTKEYEAPENSVAKVNMSESIMSFNDPAVNQSVVRELTFTPQHSDFFCSGFAIMPNIDNFEVVDWDYPNGVTDFQPFTIPADVSRTIQVRFTQGDPKKYRKATLVLEGEPCPPSITMIGGLSQIDIIYPDGGEYFTTCDVINIKWGGIERDAPVNLSYLDNGNWKPIAANATGFSYDWEPPKPGDFKVRGMVSGKTSYMCAQSAGGVGDDVAKSITLGEKEFYYYVTGHYEEEATFGEGGSSSAIEAVGSEKDIFVAKYDTECGFIDVSSFGGEGVDSAAGICSAPDPGDPDQSYVFITGSCQQGAQFGSMIPSMPLEGKNYFFVAKMYSDNLIVNTVRVIGGDVMNQSFEAWGQKIRYVDEYGGRIYVQGQYRSDRDYTIQNEFTLGSTNGQIRRFEAVFSASDLKLATLHVGGQNYDDYSKEYTFDSNGNKFDCGYFTGSLTSGNITLNSGGKKDIFTRKWGSVPGSEDQSQDFFNVETPVIYFESSSIDFGETLLGKAVPYIVQICNDGDLPVEIESIINTNETEFYFDTNEPSHIPPKSCVDVTLMFNPVNVGERTGQIIINGECSPQIILSMRGVGICGSEVKPLIDFGNVDVGTPETELQECIFKNINPNELLTFDMTIEGPHAADYYINPNDIPGVVPADECVDVDVRFTPGGPGVRSAYIVYTMPEGCFSDTTFLVGNGVDPNFPIENVDFGLRRLETINDSVIVINNQTEISIYVDNVELQNAQGDGFSIGNIDLPLEIPAKEERTIPITFVPKSEMVYDNVAMITLDIMPNTPLESRLTGIGFLPQADITYDCGNKVAYGNQTEGILRIENPSLYGVLTINDITITGSSEYTWPDGNAPQNITIEPGDIETFDVVFSPTVPGDRPVTFNVDADTKKGPDTDVFEVSELNVNCEAYGMEFTDEFDMGGVLTCDNYMQSFTIENQNSVTPIEITDVVLNGPDGQYFDIGFTNNVTINPGEMHSFDVTFSPIEERAYQANAIFQNSLDYDISFTLIGDGHIIHFNTPEKNIEAKPDERINIPVYANIPQLSYPLNNMNVLVTTNPYILKYINNSVKTDLDGWNFEADYDMVEGTVSFEGTGNLATPYDGEVFSYRYEVFLGEYKTSPVTIKSVQGECEVDFESLFTLEIENICFAEGRLVVPGDVQYSLALSPNPAGSEFEIDFGVGLEAKTTIEMYNSMGKKIQVMTDKVLKPGEYVITMPTAEIPSGLYLVRIKSGPYSETKQVVISK